MRRLFKEIILLPLQVCIEDRNAAYKGSIAKYDSALHMQLPGTIKFQTPPKKEGEVMGGTVSKVKIDGKEAMELSF